MTDLGAIEGQLDAPYDMPKQWRAWVTRFLMALASTDETPSAQRFKAVELLLKIEAINRAAVGTATGGEQDESAAAELAAVRAHLLPLQLGSEDDTTDEIARQAVAEIIRLRRRQVPATQAAAEPGPAPPVGGGAGDRPDPAGGRPGA